VRSLQTYEGSPANVHRCMEGAESPEMLEVLVLFFFPVSIFFSPCLFFFFPCLFIYHVDKNNKHLLRCSKCWYFFSPPCSCDSCQQGAESPEIPVRVCACLCLSLCLSVCADSRSAGVCAVSVSAYIAGHV
jgi:hypothetical protein